MKRVWTARSLAAVLGGSLLYFLITVLVMMCGSFSPLFWVFLPAIPPPASGWLYLYLAARTPRFGVPVLMNLVVLLLFLAAGELSGWMAVTLAAGAVLAELVRRLGGYESLRAARWSFLPLAFSSSGSPLYIWIDPARDGQPAPRKRCPQPMPRRVEGLATPGMLVLMLAAIIVGAAIGAWLGSPLWKRGQARIHIRKAWSRIGIRRKGSAE